MDYSLLEKKLNYSFRDRKLLEHALIHSSATFERFGDPTGNERYEFLGDGILGFAMAKILFKRLPKAREGELTKKRALVVCEASLHSLALELSLGDFMQFGKGESLTLGHKKASNLADALEALLAAVYLDSDFGRVYELIEELFADLVDRAVAGKLVYDFKSTLLEYGQSLSPPEVISFKLLTEEGPVHEKIFTIGAYFRDECIGSGVGSSKKEAEQNAARQALLRLGL